MDKSRIFWRSLGVYLVIVTQMSDAHHRSLEQNVGQNLKRNGSSRKTKTSSKRKMKTPTASGKGGHRGRRTKRPPKRQRLAALIATLLLFVAGALGCSQKFPKSDLLRQVLPPIIEIVTSVVTELKPEEVMPRSTGSSAAQDPGSRGPEVNTQEHRKRHHAPPRPN